MMNKIYNLIVVISTLISILLTVLDLFGRISISESPYFIIDSAILIFFTIDYVVRFFCASDRKAFFKSNIFDLIAILPFNAVLHMFRIFRVFRLAKLTKLAKITRVMRAAAFLDKIKKRIEGILKTNGFIYILYANIVLIAVSSAIMVFAEKMKFSEAIYWSIVTCTTVGYGDISPATSIGRIVAVILMIFGIGLIGTLTGAITTYFTSLKEEEPDEDFDTLISSLSDEEREKIKEIIIILRK